MPRPVHFEIQASDPAVLRTFYSTVFGWTFAKFGDEDYWVIDTGTDEGGINGGLLPRNGPPPEAGAPISGCTMVLGLDDCQGYVDKAVAAGAQVALPVTEVPGVGLMAYLTDPEGTLFGLLQPNDQ
jgi:predicted enzyme related to lactoylglutathione lyase